jgi:hypothetical protein
LVEDPKLPPITYELQACWLPYGQHAFTLGTTSAVRLSYRRCTKPALILASGGFSAGGDGGKKSPEHPALEFSSSEKCSRPQDLRLIDNRSFVDNRMNGET